VSFAFGNLFLHLTTNSIENFSRHSANLKTNLPQSNGSKLGERRNFSFSSSTVLQFDFQFPVLEKLVKCGRAFKCYVYAALSAALYCLVSSCTFHSKSKSKGKKKEKTTADRLKGHAPFPWYLLFRPRRLFAFPTSMVWYVCLPFV